MSVQVSDVDELVYDYLVDEFGESQNERARGYFVSQSLRELLGFIDDDQIQQIKGRRQVKNKSESVPDLAMGKVTDYTRIEEQIKVAFTLDYDRARGGDFRSSDVLSRIEDKGLEDVPVERIVIQFEDDDLYEHLLGLLTDTLGLQDKNEFQQPFYAVMESKQADTRHIKQQVMDYHDERYFKRGDAGKSLGFKIRTMDLMAIWSHNAWIDSDNVLFRNPQTGRKLNMKDVENLAFNRYGSEKPIYGAVNSKLVINKWRQIFGRGRTDMRTWRWSETEEWVREQ